MAKKQSIKTPAKARLSKRSFKIAQKNPFCFKVIGDLDDMDLSTTIDNVRDGLSFLSEMEPPTGHVLSAEAECGRTHFIETLREALDYAQHLRHHMEQRHRRGQAAAEVPHG